MKTTFRIFAGVIILVAALAAAGAAIVLATDPKDIQQFLATQVKEATGRDLSINGDLKFKISLLPNVIMNDVTFANAEWATAPHMLKLKQLEVGLDLLPLLQGEIKLTHIVLIDPDIRLETNAKGVGNWVFDERSNSDSDYGGEATALPILDRLILKNGHFSFKGAHADSVLSVVLKNVELDAKSPNRSLLIDVKGSYNNLPFEVSGGLAPLERLLLDPLSYQINLTAQMLAAKFKVNGNIERPLSDRKLNLTTVVEGDDINRTVSLAAQLVPQLVNFKMPPLGAIKASGRIQGPLNAINLTELKYAVGPTKNFAISGDGSIHGLPVKPKFSIGFSAKGNDLRLFSNFTGLQFQQALPYEIAGVFRNPQRKDVGDYAIDNFKLKLGSTDLKGNILVALKPNVPDIQLALQTNHFDLADIMAALPSTEERVEIKPDDDRIFPNDSFPLASLKAANVRLRFLGENVNLGGALMSDLSAGLNLENGKLVVRPFQAVFAKRQMSGQLTIDASLAQPMFKLDFKAKGTDIGKLLKDMAISDMLTGSADTHLKLEGVGSTWRQVMAGLNGKTEIIMQEGAVASKYLDLIAADLIKALVPDGGRPNTTKINCLVNRFDVKSGLATNTGMLFDTEKMTVSGSGKIDLRTETLAMRIKPQPKDASLISLAVPINIGGTLKSPTATPSSTAVLTGIAGIALSVVNPVSLLALTLNKGADDKNPCVAALEQKN